MRQNRQIHPGAVKAWVHVGSMPLAISKAPAISFSAQIVFHQTSLIVGSLPVTVASPCTVCIPAAPQKAANPPRRGGFAFGLFCLSLSLSLSLSLGMSSASAVLVLVRQPWRQEVKSDRKCGCANLPSVSSETGPPSAHRGI